MKRVWRSNYRKSGKVKSGWVLAESREEALELLSEKFPDVEILWTNKQARTEGYFDPFIPWEQEFPGIKDYRTWHRLKYKDSQRWRFTKTWEKELYT